MTIFATPMPVKFRLPLVTSTLTILPNEANIKSVSPLPYLSSLFKRKPPSFAFNLPFVDQVTIFPPPSTLKSPLPVFPERVIKLPTPPPIKLISP
ncbi:hypothetical protein BAZSYMB_SCAFFOLD00028_4 [Bathymodiolus azoricus thioautotrophic gill symbiont]|uniref:Uncharacterized protein n=1 Tax=Bathymodiolus azoricus thioautotrophic gill symbiont TaxID=235205 RepID=A0A1H6KLF2_9GAMM|nr:hypothetical protein BAZSYMB_SCAFFOLD00028_4 [Bathymodiolus azoricus thioautotrophic gill symbiont]